MKARNRIVDSSQHNTPGSYANHYTRADLKRRREISAEQAAARREYTAAENARDADRFRRVRSVIDAALYYGDDEYDEHELLRRVFCVVDESNKDRD